MVSARMRTQVAMLGPAGTNASPPVSRLDVCSGGVCKCQTSKGGIDGGISMTAPVNKCCVFGGIRSALSHCKIKRKVEKERGGEATES